MRYFFAFLLLIHGFIHLLGFAKAFRYADISQLTLAISRPAGLLWLLCTVLFVVAVVLFLLQNDRLRYLAETVWFPSAVLNDYIQWESIDATTARATMNYGGITASGTFRFNTEGDVLSFEAKRYYDRKTGATLEDWLI